jgi:hypothetical protein
MRQTRLMSAVWIVLLAGPGLTAQAHRPVVMMSITPPGEQAQQVSAPESGLATIKVKDGTAFGFRPTLQDNSPWTRTEVTIFRMDPSIEILGTVDVKTGGPAVESKTKPAFRIAVTKVSPQN